MNHENFKSLNPAHPKTCKSEAQKIIHHISCTMY